MFHDYFRKQGYKTTCCQTIKRASAAAAAAGQQAHLVLDGEDGQVGQAADGELGVQVRERAQQEPRERQVVGDLHLLSLFGGDEVLLEAERQAAQLCSGRRRRASDRE